MIINFKGEKCKVVFDKYENGNTGFKIYSMDDKLILSPTVNIGYIMNKEYVTLKDRNKDDEIGIELKKEGVLSRKLDTINMEHGGALSLYMLTEDAKNCLE